MADKPIEVINRTIAIEEKLKTSKSWIIDSFKPNYYVDVLDQNKTWCVAQITERKSEIIKIHYDGWSSKFDEVRSFINYKKDSLNKKFL